MNLIINTVLLEKQRIGYMCNSSGSYEGKKFDFIFGPVANDDVYTTFTLYTAEVLTKEQTLEALKIKKLYNQLVLTSEKVLSYLRFIGTVPEGEF